MYIAIKKMDKDELKFCELRDKVFTDLTSMINIAKQVGVKEGVRETARKALAKGATIEFISEITGLTEQQINEL